MAWLLTVPYVLIGSLSLYILSAWRFQRTSAGLWAMRGSKRSYTGGGQVRPLTQQRPSEMHSPKSNGLFE